ncbi:Neurotransmitter-gated ion-channel transmembrane region [Cooperia oncophora]
MPCMLTMVLVVLGFTLSPETCEKVGLQISVSLAICIFLTIMNEMTPHTSEAVPLLDRERDQWFQMRFILLEWAPWLLRMEFPERKNTISTIKESWASRNRKRRGTITAFDFVQTDDVGASSVGLAVKENLDNFISQVSASIKDDDRLLERIRVLQKIHDHVKVGILYSV